MGIDIDQLSAGVELDILVAEALGYVQATSMVAEAEGVFIVVEGIPSISISNDRVYIRQGAGDFTYFAPSTDIVDAWKVVARALNQQGYTLRLTGPEVPDATGYLIEKSWSAAFVEPQYAFTNVGQSQGRGSTPSLAICRAALKVMGHKEESTEVDCQHEFFKCRVPAGDSCVAVYHQVCSKCHWDESKDIIMPLDIWRGWAMPQLEKLQNYSSDEK